MQKVDESAPFDPDASYAGTKKAKLRSDRLKLIVGLGNPGTRYRLSRHNAGFLILDRFALEHDIPIAQTLFDAHIGKGRIDGSIIIIAKPQTFMNLSGIAIRKLTDYFRIPVQEVIVAHDDLDLQFQSIRLKAGGGHGGHKGLMSAIDHLGAPDFIRLRLGIGKPACRTMVEGYVLEHFSKDEMECLPQLITDASEALTDILLSGIQAAMNKHHGKINTNLIEEG